MCIRSTKVNFSLYTCLYFVRLYHLLHSHAPALTHTCPHTLTRTGDADWSDYALWWPENRIWLNKPRQSLYAYGIMSDAKLDFVPVHRYISVELPDKQRYQMRVNFAVMTFFAVAEICREMNVRHPEELSLMRSPLDKENYAKLTGWVKKGRKVRALPRAHI